MVCTIPFRWGTSLIWHCHRVSATNSSRIYNLSFSGIEEHIRDKWPLNFKLMCDHVWDAFFIYALLLDANERNVPLDLDHNAPDNAQHLCAALDAHNKRIVGPGQEFWNDACDLCCEITERNGVTGKFSLQISPQLLIKWIAVALSATVSDGITIGHPCCAHYDCKNPLPTQRSKFCVEHASLSSLCAVTTCSRSVELNFQTCSLPEHRKLENVGLEQYTALFQLRRRLDKLKTSHVEDSVEPPLATLHADELIEVNTRGECAGKPPDGNLKLRAVFGRCRTHNEQLCVTTCGIILGCTTFFGSEGPYGVVVCPCYSCLSLSILIRIKKFHEKLFPTPQSVPGVIFYDNNCHIKRVLEKSRNLHFQWCALPVDVFHMKTKHKESNEFCNTFCNPARFPDLIHNGKWRFNSSAAEMTNVWFGGYQALVREMWVDRYNFFLDEMIKRRNQIIVKDLQKWHAYPYQIPCCDLLS